MNQLFLTREQGAKIEEDEPKEVACGTLYSFTQVGWSNVITANNKFVQPDTQEQIGIEDKNSLNKKWSSVSYRLGRIIHAEINDVSYIAEINNMSYVPECEKDKIKQ